MNTQPNKGTKRERICELWDQGMTISQIVASVGGAWCTVTLTLKQYRPGYQTENLRRRLAGKVSGQ